MITLVRFMFDRETKKRIKRMNPIDLSFTLKIKPSFMKDPIEDVCLYDLYALIIHAGKGVNAGHYYTLAKESTWSLFNDSHVTKVTESFIKDFPYVSSLVSSLENEG
jgi:ubiquitin C-terminal hydrolase